MEELGVAETELKKIDDAEGMLKALRKALKSE